MGISKQIGWSPEANLYYQISQQLERLISVTSKVVLGPPPDIWYQITECYNATNVVNTINYPMGTFELNDRVTDSATLSIWTITNIISTDPGGTQYSISSLGGTSCPPQTVTIGTQVWTARNLDVTRYRNGDIIPQVQDPTQWTNLTTGAWCYYDYDYNNGLTYGKLYNWYAVNDPRGLAPTGFHVPSNAEMTTLKGFLDPDAGGHMKEIGTTYWINPNNGADNTSGFTALGAGYRNAPSFSALQVIMLWWMADEVDLTDAYCSYLFHNSAELNIAVTNPKKYGFSVRCIKD